MQYKYTLIGLGLDAFDWLVVGMIPILGDVVDLIGTFLWVKKLGMVGAVDLIELFPGADVLPTNVILGFMADRKQSGKSWGV